MRAHTIIAGSTILVNLDFSSEPVSSQEQIAIKVYTRRQNVAFYTHFVQ
jgi:hypothetical protein